MIAKVAARGNSVVGLLRYLWGPGRHEEHRNPRLVAAFDGAGPLAELEPHAHGRRQRFQRLVNLLEMPMLAREGLPPKRPVWHASLRAAPGDPIMSDARWAAIAVEFMDHTGLARIGDEHAMHWIAMRHGDDHIHLAAIRVRTDGRIEPARFDAYKARAAAVAIEQRYGLTATAPADHTRASRPSRAEQEYARRHGWRETSRERLQRQVRAAAAAATDERHFFQVLRERGHRVRLRYSTTNPEQVTGYAVALGGSGDPVYFGGGRLAPDLSLPRLRRRWQSTPGNPPPAEMLTNPLDAYRLAAEATREAAHYLRTSGLRDPDAADATALAAADLLTAVAWRLEGKAGGPVTSAAVLLDQAARHVGGGVPVRRIPQAGRLRHLARVTGTMEHSVQDSEVRVILRLLGVIAALADTLIALRQAQQRLHQAEAARLAAQHLRHLAGVAETRSTPDSPQARARMAFPSSATKCGRSNPHPGTDTTGRGDAHVNRPHR